GGCGRDRRNGAAGRREDRAGRRQDRAAGRVPRAAHQSRRAPGRAPTRECDRRRGHRAAAPRRGPRRSLCRSVRADGCCTQRAVRARALPAAEPGSHDGIARRRAGDPCGRRAARSAHRRPVGPGARAVTRRRLSVVVVTLNEEERLRACLESVAWADEIVVVDGLSHDKTVQIAREFTDRVMARPWPGFAAQKNFGLAEASGDWILSLDADEQVSPELREEILRVLDADGPDDGY